MSLNTIRLRTLLAAAALGLVVGQVAQAQITSVARGGSSTNDAPAIAAGPLVEDALTFVDRTHEYNEVPGFLSGAQYVMVANNDKTTADYSLEVTVGDADILLCLIIDERVGDGNADDGPTLGDKMGWALDLGFTDTGANVGIDEGGDGDIDNFGSIYTRLVQAGETITLLEQDDSGGRNMYGVAALSASAGAAVPASSPFGLIALAVGLLLVGGIVLRRRLATNA